MDTKRPLQYRPMANRPLQIALWIQTALSSTVLWQTALLIQTVLSSTVLRQTALSRSPSLYFKLSSAVPNRPLLWPLHLKSALCGIPRGALRLAPFLALITTILYGEDGLSFLGERWSYHLGKHTTRRLRTSTC